MSEPITECDVAALVAKYPRGKPSGPAAIHFCPVPDCLDIWESEATCEHAALIPECSCPYTPPETWLSAASCGYGGGYEPGSMQEWNTDCPEHGTRITSPGVDQ